MSSFLAVLSLLLLLLSHFSRIWLCVTPSLGFSRQEHWRGLPFPSPMHASEKWEWSRSVVSDSSWPHGLQPYQAPPPMGFPRQEYWSGVPLSSPVLSLRYELDQSWPMNYISVSDRISTENGSKNLEMFIATR